MTSLADAKTGELVIYSSGYGVQTGESVVTIKRTTATRIIIAGASEGSERSFWREGGRELGATGYRISRIEAGTPERIQKARDDAKRSRIAAQFQHRNWSNLSLATLEEVERILAASKNTAA